jgi:tRNA (mo5U34)-methyltransferase
MESLARICRHALVGTHVFTHTPQLRHCIEGSPVAYLVESNELNHDPTNFWIFSAAAFARLARRAGFDVMESLQVPNNPLNIAVPDQPDLGVRNFLMLRSRHVG